MSAHADPTRQEFGFVAEPRDFFWRADEAMQRTDRRRYDEALWLADATIGGETEAWRIPIRADFYREAVAADEYARAVYEVEAAKVRAR